MIAALVSQRHSSAKQMIDVGSAPPTLTAFSQSLLAFHGLYLDCISTGAPSSESSHDSTTLTPGRSPLNRASVASGMLSLRMVSSHFLPLTYKPIALSLSSNTTKLSWTLSGESSRVVSSKYHTLNLMSTLEGKTMHPRCHHIGACWDLLVFFWIER